MAGLTQKLPFAFARFARSSQLIGAKVPHRYSSFRSSKPVADISEYPEVEVVRNPPEWKFVERLLPPVTIPKPDAKAEYPSGWQAPKAIADQKYFVARTKNHMLPVYLQTKFRGLRRLTVVRYIQGDIWALEKELHQAIEAHKGKVVASRVNELSGQIQFHGDYVNLVKDLLLTKGF